MRKSTKLKKIPTLRSDSEAARFVSDSDLSQFDISGGRFVRFEMKAKDKSINLRLPSPLLDAVRARARSAGIPYQRFIRLALERAVISKRS